MNYILKLMVFLILLAYSDSSVSDESNYNYYDNINIFDTDSDEINPEITTYPSIKVINFSANKPWENDWDILNVENNKTTLISKHREDLVLHLECTAPYDIMWITGGNEHLEMTKLGIKNEARVCASFPEMINGTNVYKRTLTIRFNPDLKSAVGEVRCEHSILTTNTKVSIFLPGEKSLLNNGQNLTYAKYDTWIKCPSSDPRIPVSLFIEDPETSALQKIENITYDPLKGFPVSINMTDKAEIFICSAIDNGAVRFELQNLQRIKAKALFPIPQVQIHNFAADKPWENDWETIRLENNDTNIVAKHNNQPILHLVCIASEEIVWLFNNEFDKTLNTVIDCDNFSEVINGTKFYSRTLSVRFQSVPGSISNIRCKHNTDNDLTRINIFIPGPADKPLIHSGQNITYYNHHHQKLLRCPTSDPRIPVTLWSEDSETGATQHITNATYNPLIGFNIESTDVNYVCSSGKNDKVRFVPHYLYHRRRQQIIPTTTVPYRTTERIEFSKYFTFMLKQQDISSRCEENEYNYNNVLVIQGGVNNAQDNRSTIITSSGRQHWLGKPFEDVHFNITYKDYHIVDFFCIRDDPNLNTNDPIRGKVLSKWSVSSVSKRSRDKLSENESYYSISKDNVSSSYGGLSWEQFRVDEEVFMISDGGYTMYSNLTSNFTCKTGSKSANLTFWMEVADGTRTVLQDDPSKFVKVEVDERQFLKFKTWKVSVRLPVDAVSVICEIPYGSHPSLYLSAERRFRTAYLNAPVILNSPKENSSMELTVGEIHHKLTCECLGEPQPKYIWVKDGQNLSESLDLNLRSTVDHYGNGVLEFPSITKFHEGTYSCNAKNRIGSDSYNFTVLVQEAIVTNPESQVVLVGSILCFVIAVVLLGLAFHRYYKTKIMVKKNVDQELNDLM